MHWKGDSLNYGCMLFFRQSGSFVPSLGEEVLVSKVLDFEMNVFTFGNDV